MSALSSRPAGSPGSVLLVGGTSSGRRDYAGWFGGQGWRVTEIATLIDALDVARERPWSAVILIDEALGRPLFDALTDLRSLAAEPIYVMLVGEHYQMADVVGPALGADAVAAMSVTPVDLEARVAQLVNERMAAAAPLRFGYNVLDVEKRRVYCGGKEVALSPARWLILLDLVSHPMVTRSFAHLYEVALHRPPSDDRPRLVHTVTEHVRNVRLVVEPVPHRPRWIRNVRTIGYRFDPGD